jgi:hypothetical protein
MYFEIPLPPLRQLGVTTPELPRVTANPLKDWDIHVPTLRPVGQILRVSVQEDATQEGRKGVLLEVQFETRNNAGENFLLTAEFASATGLLKSCNGDYRADNGNLCVRSQVKVNSRTGLGTARLFLPADEVQLPPGWRTLMWLVQIHSLRDKTGFDQVPRSGLVRVKVPGPVFSLWPWSFTRR